MDNYFKFWLLVKKYLFNKDNEKLIYVFIVSDGIYGRRGVI